MVARIRWALGLWIVCLASGFAWAEDKYELEDVQLDLVTAGTQSGGQELMEFDFTRTTRSGRTISGDGSVVLLDSVVQPESGFLVLGEGAQGNLRSLININAVNSTINVLLNLNINIDSSVGTLNQLNVNSTVPRALSPTL